MLRGLTAAILISLISASLMAQAPRGQGRGGARQVQVTSPEITADRHITFRIVAPQAQAVRLSASDISNLGQANVLMKGDNGVWSTTIGPVAPGAYRYNFSVDGVATIDPRNPATSESNANTWSLLYVPGAEFMDTRNVPHGVVSTVHYFSTALNTWRRMHVYTPPGYELANEKMPVFYLLHGAGDSDDSWTSAGRANFILDNLIAAKKAKPMIVVMTAGHTPPRQGAAGGFLSPTDDFARDFTTDVMPYIEKHYRVFTDRAHTAIAGLSMGGSQTLNIAIPHLARFAYIGVFSSGLIGEFPTAPRGGRGGNAAAAAPQNPPAAPAETPAPSPNSWETRNLALLDNSSLKKGLKLLWFDIGKDDNVIGATAPQTVELLKKHGFNPVFEHSEGGHTWINWRDYLNLFAPQLFQ